MYTKRLFIIWSNN